MGRLVPRGSSPDSQPRGQLPALDPQCWDATGTHALRTGTCCRTRCRWGRRMPGPGDPPPHSSARRPGASAPLCARAPHPVRTRPSPAPGGCSVGPRGPVSRPEPATVTMCHRVSTWTPSRLVWGGTTGRGEGVRTLGIYAQAGDTPWLPVTAPCRGEGCLLPTRRPDPRPGRDSWGAPCPGHKGAPLHRGRDPWQAGWRPAGQV